MEGLAYERKSTSAVMTEQQIKAASDFCEGYKTFLDFAKTERFAVKYTIAEAEKNGYVPFEYGKNYSAGDRIYLNQKGKAVIFAQIGSDDIENGFGIIAAHIDCPRLDLKYRPLYEDNGLAMFKTHYYGGIKDFQWFALPLMLCGVVCKKDGTVLDIRIGEKASDPVFCITDLLPHLAKAQARKPLGEVYTGESLNILVGSSEDKDAEKDKITATVLKILYETYGIKEEDLLTAELSAVPLGNARDLGFDKSMILAFGHDDRVCSYPAFKALMERKAVKRTTVVVLTDKEEIGSMGITGLRSAYLYDFLAELAGSKNKRKAFANSEALSADVSAAFDPNFADVYEFRNNAVINGGVAINKFTGSGGKYSASDADPVYMASICDRFDKAGVLYHFAEMGKVDAGGGGTVSQYLADKNIETLDVGVPLLSMHAPYEVASKTDIYMLFKACETFII